MSSPEQITATSEMAPEERYHPISQYGVVGDCRTAALIAPDGSIDWCCLPHFDSPAIFCRLLDAERGGYFRVAPDAPMTTATAYVTGTNVLETIFGTEPSGSVPPSGSAPPSASSQVRLTDFMPIRPRHRLGHRASHVASSLVPHVPEGGLRQGLEHVAGNDVAAAHRLTRIATAIQGDHMLALTLKATFDYARQLPSIERQAMNANSAGAILSAGKRFLVLVVRREGTTSDGAAQPPITLGGDDHIIQSNIPLAQGQRLIAMLNYARTMSEARHLLEQLIWQDVDADLAETLQYWRGWSAKCRYSGPHRDIVVRSALALKLCIFEPTGAIVAAPTTSLPEGIGGVRNWDYRYTWLRDSAFTLEALGRLGYHDEARDYFHFLHDLHIKHGADLHIMYTIRGEWGDVMAEQELTYLDGYRGSRPVRIGNGAATQRQLDVYGELLDSAYRYVVHSGYRKGRRRREANRALHSLVFEIAEYVADHWQDPDRGIWEVRGDPQPFVYSRAMCWVALERACRLSNLHGQQSREAHWRQARDAIAHEIMQQGYSQRLQSFTQFYDADVVDAANLRLPLVGFIAPDDPLMINTLAATVRYLHGPNGLLFRYRSTEMPSDDPTIRAGTTNDGLPGTEGAFVACTFWLIDTLCRAGRIDDARERFEHMIQFASPLGLFAEEIDPDSGAHLGNFQQAFTHVGLINAAVSLQKAQEGTLAPTMPEDA